ncbi:MAG: SIS domain-containing protein [Patescibacteria group bacterium]|jgi:glucose/mannose-6-phosphate isomerase
MIDVDDVVFKSINLFPEQIKDSFKKSSELNLPKEYQQVKNIIACGMGGSRFPHYIIKELFKEEIKIPYLINDDYILPGFVNDNTLVVLSSYSGTTEEVLTVGQKAYEKNAKIIGISNGGELKFFLEKIEAPGYFFDPVFNPSNQPRIGFGYLIGGIIGLLFNLKILNLEKNNILLSINNINIKKIEEDAKFMAQKIINKYPYYIVSEFLTGIGNAIANQTNETAKSISSFRVIPELNHHLMEGLKNPKELAKISLFIFFFSKLFSPSIQKRFHITKEVVEKNNIETVWYELRGENKIEQAFELMIFGNFLTMYLSSLYGENPAAVPYVDYFKKKLKEV